ncbi:MAG TPA: gluconate 2-dehydrogenase subunit 3 family protein [Gaiellaceae bacterium]|jgi:gluconate 2-dehydrogenase gamma chain|nr:gluconate 2-dehydrogenase subunit 3 family protein [Gaiellaceae bacterium]
MSSDDKDRERVEGAGGVMSRSALLRRGAFAGIAGASVAGGLIAPVAEAQPTAADAETALRFLSQWEFTYLTSMAETIWPTDSSGPGAKEAGVANYIDGQLAGGWGQGHRFYLNGPFFQPQSTGHGWQVPMTPAEVYRAFLPGFDVYCKTTYGNPYPQLPAATQTQALTDLSAGKADIQIGGSTAFGVSDFFGMFRQNVLEGMLADPAYGGNKNMVGWKWIGFPGDPMQRGDPYEKYIFTDKAYPYANKPLPLAKPAAVTGALRGAAETGKAPADFPNATLTSASTDSMKKSTKMGG